MLLEASTLQALALAGAVGAISGLIGGFVASADNLLGTVLTGIIGGIALSAVFRLAGVPAIYGVGSEDFSLVWAALGGLVLGFVVGRANN
ncbi:MAG TPA: hypothetical protein VG872_02580 [Acidimicrobiia bacterium]|jgi:hypothetical protein|nr:hypothetical protein [Acidimicrobiia bacterium]